MLSKYKEDMFLVKDVRRQITEAKTILNSESGEKTQTTTSINQIQEQLKHTVLLRQASQAALKAKSEALAAQLRQTRTSIAALNDRALQIARLERDAAIEEGGYRRYSENLEQTRLDHALEIERISNVMQAQPPTLEKRVASPRKLVNYAIGFLLATLGGLSLTVLAEYFDPASRISVLAEELDLPAPPPRPRVVVRSPVNPLRREHEAAVEEVPESRLV